MVEEIRCLGKDLIRPRARSVVDPETESQVVPDLEMLEIVVGKIRSQVLTGHSEARLTTVASKLGSKKEAGGLSLTKLESSI